MTDIATTGLNFSSWAGRAWDPDEEEVLEPNAHGHRLLGLALNGHGFIPVTGPARLVATASLSFRLRTPANGPITEVVAWMLAGRPGLDYKQITVGLARVTFGRHANDHRQITVAAGLEIDAGDWDVQVRAANEVRSGAGVVGFYQGGLIAVTTPLAFNH